MAAMSAGLAIQTISKQGEEIGLSPSDEWTVKQWAECAQTALATPWCADALKELNEIDGLASRWARASAVNPSMSLPPEVATYLNSLTELAFKDLLSVLKGSDKLKESSVVQEVLEKGTSALLKSYGDKESAESAVGHVLRLVSTNVIRKMAAMFT
jgi:hypothetical protein